MTNYRYPGTIGKRGRKLGAGERYRFLQKVHFKRGGQLGRGSVDGEKMG